MAVRRMFFFLLLCLAFGCLAIVQLDLLIWLILLAPLTFSLAALHGYRIDQLSRNRLGLIVAVKGNSLAVTGSYLVPARLSEILKPIYYRKERSLPIVDGISIVVVERTFDVVALLVLVGLAIALRGDLSRDVSQVQLFALLLIFVVILGMTFVVKFPRLTTLIVNALLPKAISKVILDLAQSLRFGLKAGLTIKQIVATSTAWIGSWFIYWCFLQIDGGVSVSAYGVLIIFLAGTVGLAFTITPGGLGTFEAVVIYSLQAQGYDLGSAAVTALGLRLMAIMPSAVIAAYTVFTEGSDYLSRRFLEKQRWS